MAAYCICISVQNILTYKVLASVSVKPLALLSILWAATEYPNSSVSTPRTGENLTMGLNVSMVLKEATALYNSSRHRPVATDLSIVLHRARQNVEMSKKIIRNGISTRYGISGMWMWLRIINRACSATINQYSGITRTWLSITSQCMNTNHALTSMVLLYDMYSITMICMVWYYYK